jgi:fatty acid desaturase
MSIPLPSPLADFCGPPGTLRPEKSPRRFVERSNPRGLLAVSRDWLLIFCIAALSVSIDNFFFYLVAVWAIGALQFALGESLIHEASHYNLFKTRSWNDRLEFLYALPFWQTIDQFRTRHLLHHRKLGTSEDHIVADYEAIGLNRPGRNFFWLWFLRPVLGYGAYFYLGSTSLRPWRSGVKIVAFWAAVIGVFWGTGTLSLLFAYWVVPFLWAYGSFVYWSEVSDHYNSPAGTRSNLNRISNLVTHNNGYHFLHHRYPSIPWYRLPAAYRCLCPGEGEISAGFLETYRQLKTSSPAGSGAGAATRVAGAAYTLDGALP